MKKLSTDWHIHTEDSCDSACLRMADLVAEQKQNGITDYGVTDQNNMGAAMAPANVKLGTKIL